MNYTRKMTSENALILFIRNPERGKVKTRLANKLGKDKALEIYKALLQHTREVALEVDARRMLFYSEQIAQEDEWKRTHFDKYLQSGQTLGVRMHRAFELALEQSSKAVIVGSDIAQIHPSILKAAFSELDRHDYVIGPAIDGGYYLLGMKSPNASLFQDIEWSTNTVCEETLDKIRSQGGSYKKVETLSDIDYAEDWEKYGWEI
jgi:hypothetical protein